MLKSLHIKNYAIIDDISIDFEDGFNVFTGETGAGKSIIVGALSMLLKGRSDSSLIKMGCSKAVVEGVFTIDNNEIRSKLDEQDIFYEDEVIIKRVISEDNHNTIKINESNVTLNFLTDLLDGYVDIHSQKDSHYLYNKSNQLKLLDKYADINELLKEYTSAYNEYINKVNDLDCFKNSTFSEREIEFFKYDFNELEKADLKLDEEKELEDIENRIKQSEKYLNILNYSINLFNKDSGIKEQLFNLINNLNINDSKISKIRESLNNSYYAIDDDIRELESVLDDFNLTDTDINSIEERLYLYAKLKRKHKTDVQGLINLKNELEEKINSFVDFDRVLADKQNAVIKAKENALEIARNISEIRHIKALSLEKDVVKETGDLLLNNCSFKIRINTVELNKNGIDDIEFLVSMNKGEIERPLKNVASGGEVSRLMLALKCVFAKLSNTSLLIFDEIDTGVSGRVALAVGEKIAGIAKNIQVLCITHLAPVAACAKNHYYIYKVDIDDHTTTSIKKFNKEQIIEELASISSSTTNENAINAALELYDYAQRNVK